MRCYNEGMAKRAASTKQQQPETFEAALDELEQITSRMERGDVPLDESLRLYERGTFLIRHCQERLDSAEKQIEQLGKGDGGKLTAKPMQAADDAEGESGDE